MQEISADAWEGTPLDSLLTLPLCSCLYGKDIVFLIFLSMSLGIFIILAQVLSVKLHSAIIQEYGYAYIIESWKTAWASGGWGWCGA